MTKTVHNIYIGTMTFIAIAVTAYLFNAGYSYYAITLEERFYHPQHDWFKPSGAFGHGLGIVGTLMILFGVAIYIARKRYNFLHRVIRLKYLLEFHIFLCSLGPVLILFHTAFKFGGIVSVAFWSMLAVVASGVIGRFVYIQIPRTVEGRELSLSEVKSMKAGLSNTLKGFPGLSENLKTQIMTFESSSESQAGSSFMANYFSNKKAMKVLKAKLKMEKLDSKQRSSVLSILQEEISLAFKQKRLQTMQQLFKYWHVAHLPFALVMLIILIIHVAVTLSFGYKWIF